MSEPASLDVLDETPEPLAAFETVRAWLAEHLLTPRSGSEDPMPTDPDGIAEARRIQRRLFDEGFARLCFPREYGERSLPGPTSWPSPRRPPATGCR